MPKKENHAKTAFIHLPFHDSIIQKLPQEKLNKNLKKSQRKINGK